ncbi:MAG: hypothetical protein ACR2G7_09790, partial [Acidimicrobiales bacterium]
SAQVALAPDVPELLEGPEIEALPLLELERDLGMGGAGDDHPAASVLALLAERVDALDARLSTVKEHKSEAEHEEPVRAARIELALSDLSQRVAQLSEQAIGVPSAPELTVDVESAVSAHLDELVAKMTEHLDRLSGRVAELEAKEGARPESSVQAVVEDALKGVDQRMQQLSSQLSSQLASLEALPSRMAELERAGEMPQERFTEMMSERLLPFASVLTTLKGLPERLTALEEVTPSGDQPAVPPVLVEDVERLSAQVAMLRDVPDQVKVVVEEVKERLGGFPDPSVLTDVVQRSERTVAHLDRLSSQLAPMQAVPKRVEAVEKVLGRVNALQKVVAGLVHGEQERAATMASLEEVPERLAALEHVEARTGVIDAGLVDLSRNLEQLSAQLSSLGDVPKRLEALEQFPSAATEKLLESITERLDLLAAHAAQLQDVPERLAGVEVGSRTRSEIVQNLFIDIGAQLNAQKAVLHGLPERLDLLEDSAVRTSALAGGLGAAIDMLDQLAAQVAALEPASAMGLTPQVDVG